ncbi:MAG: glycerol-3-phosphate 1-O-acyltransferase PlsY [Desulfosalsimonadaceae bacterium]
MVSLKFSITLKLTGILIFSYLLGSIPFGLLLVKWIKSVDLRRAGSGNIGATNALRTGGRALGLATLLLDGSKGALPVYLAGVVCPASAGLIHPLAMGGAAVCAFCGHLFPLYLGCRASGKGVATAAGCFLLISPLSLLTALLLFLTAAALTRRVSPGSLAAAAALPPAVLLIEKSWILAGAAAVIAVLIIVRHKDNIRRLLAGHEPPFR